MSQNNVLIMFMHVSYLFGHQTKIIQFQTLLFSSLEIALSTELKYKFLWSPCTDYTRLDLLSPIFGKGG